MPWWGHEPCDARHPALYDWGRDPLPLRRIECDRVKAQWIPPACQTGAQQSVQNDLPQLTDLQEALLRIEQELEPLPEIQHWLKFCRESKRGLTGIAVLEEELELSEEEEYSTVE